MAKKRYSQTKVEGILKRHRIEKGITQAELARKLGYSSSQFVSNWERGMCRAPLKDYRKLSKILNVSFVNLKTLKLYDYIEYLESI